MAASRDIKRWGWIAAAAVSAAVAGGILVFLIAAPPSWLETGDKLASILGAVVAVVALVLSVRASRDDGPPKSSGPAGLPDAVCDRLAGQVNQQWKSEAQARGLLRPEPLKVRWYSTGLPVAPAASEVIGGGAGRVKRLKLSGDVLEVAAAWRQLPARQLVVIGAAGAGKTSLTVLLVCELLAQRKPGEAVPVLLDLSSWSPDRESLEAWLTRHIADQYQLSASRSGPMPLLARQLVDAGRIIPVLDGLDELREPMRAVAIRAISDAVGNDGPVVLTCRTQQYQDAIAATGVPLARAAVVEMEPVTAAQVGPYLQAGQVEGHRRWSPVLEHLRAQPSGALAAALSTPLMAYLARTAYTPPSTDPATLTRFTSVESIERHLLEAYVPTLYAPSDTRRSGSHPRLHPYRPENALAWHTFLAWHMHRRRTRDLAWWRLITSVSRYRLLVGLVVGMGVFLTFMLPIALLMPTLSLRFFVLGSGVGVAILVGMTLPDFVTRLHRTHLRLVSAWTMGVLSLGAVAVLATYLALGAGFTIGLAVALLILLSMVLSTGAAPVGSDDLNDPRAALRDDRASLLVSGIMAASITALLAGGILALEISVKPAAVSALLVALTIAVLSGLIRGRGAAWIGYSLARFWLAGRGDLPWRTMRFLEDARRRGILRQSGAVYQFRHSRLQDYLAFAGLLDTLARRRKTDGHDHPETLTLASNVADELYQLGEYAQARQLDEDTLARRRRILGDDHPDTLASADNLARDLEMLHQG